MEKNGYDFSKLFNIKKFYAAYMTNVAKENGVGVGCLVFLKALSTKEFRSQQELSEFVGCNKAHTSRIITKMQEMGFVEVAQNKADAPLTLTKKGIAFGKKAEKLHKEYTEKLVEDVPQEELEVFRKVCKQIYKNSEKLANS